MVGKLEKVLSWADEVELEEEEAAHQQVIVNVNENQKPNPFGSARPREVVLQERSRNHHVDSFASSDFSLADQKINPMKENIPASPFDKNCIVDSEASPNRSPGLRAPPLKYPPRAYLPFLYQNQNHHHQIGRKEEVGYEEAGRFNAKNHPLALGDCKVSSMAKQGKIGIGRRRKEPEDCCYYYPNGGHAYNNRERDETESEVDMGMASQHYADGNYKTRRGAMMMNSKTYNGNVNRGRR